MTPIRTGRARRAAIPSTTASATASALGPARAALAGLLLGAAAAPLLAQTVVPGTAAQGYAIYQNGTGGKPACASCHTADPNANINNIQTIGAGNPAAILNAWETFPAMSALMFWTVIDLTGRTGLANYLEFPAAATAPFSNLSVGSIQFGSVTVGQSATQTVTLANIGAAAITGLAVQPLPSAAGVTETTDCGATLASGASCSINVTFAPTAVGPANGGYVANSSNDANSAAGRTFFVYATGAAASAPAPAASGGGGGVFGWPGLAGLLAAAAARRARSRRAGAAYPLP